MKNNLSSLALLLMIILSACGVDNSAPNRLVGHWKAETAIQTEYYISPIDPKTGKGNITEYSPRNDTVFIGKYKIHRLSNDGYKVTLNVDWPGEFVDGLIVFVIREDGKSSSMHNYIINYVDSQTEHMEYATQPSIEPSPKQFSGCPNGCPFHPEGCDIKGNVSIDTKEKIYHVPGGEFYDECVINPEYGERWFCTESEALANGWRKSFK